MRKWPGHTVPVGEKGALCGLQIAQRRHRYEMLDIKRDPKRPEPELAAGIG